MGALSKRDAENTLNRYENVIAFDEMDDENTEDWGLNDPPYLMMARVAEMWISGELKQGIKKYFFKKFLDHLFFVIFLTKFNLHVGRDPQRAGDMYNQAAESAMASMKGKLSNKYYMLAEEAWGEIEE